MRKDIDELITKGQSFTYYNNTYQSASGFLYWKAPDEYIVWVYEVKGFIIQNFGENCLAYELYGKVDREKLHNYLKKEFEIEHNKLIAALKICYGLKYIENPSSIVPNNLLYTVFEKFHSVAQQLKRRHANRETLTINDEYDVQDLLHALLKIHVNDIRNEEWTPSYAGGSSRVDFLLKGEKIVIEVKMMRKGLTDKALGEQLIIDKTKYQAHQDCKKLICFVYDPEGVISNPVGIQNDLNQKVGEFPVEIIIKPNH